MRLRPSCSSKQKTKNKNAETTLHANKRVNSETGFVRMSSRMFFSSGTQRNFRGSFAIASKSHLRTVPAAILFLRICVHCKRSEQLRRRRSQVMQHRLPRREPVSQGRLRVPEANSRLYSPCGLTMERKVGKKEPETAENKDNAVLFWHPTVARAQLFSERRHRMVCKANDLHFIGQLHNKRPFFFALGTAGLERRQATIRLPLLSPSLLSGAHF